MAQIPHWLRRCQNRRHLGPSTLSIGLLCLAVTCLPAKSFVTRGLAQAPWRTHELQSHQHSTTLVSSHRSDDLKGRLVSMASFGQNNTQEQLDTDALSKYASSIIIQMLAITAFFFALDKGIASYDGQIPDWSIFALFYGMSLRSRIFSPLDNSRPDITKAVKGESSGGFNDRMMPSWTPPGVVFPIMWILIVGPLRAASSFLIWQQVGHLCDVTILALMFHLSIGDTWNTINNVERRLGAAVPGVLCVCASAIFAAYSYYQVLPFAGELLLPTCLWLTVAAALVTDTWRVNNTAGTEPLYPYRGATITKFWFAKE